MTFRGTTDKRKVEVPEWAQQYEVEDEIRYRNPLTGGVESAIVVGFSSRKGNEGLPIIYANGQFPDDDQLEWVEIPEEFVHE